MTPVERRQMMLSGPIVPTILTLAAPNVLNVAMQSLVSISDAFFVGRLGILDLAALALVFPTQMALGQMSAGAMGGGGNGGPIWLQLPFHSVLPLWAWGE